MWARKFWYRFVIITMYFSAGLIPVFIIMKTLGLTNNFWVYVLPFIVQPFNIILVKTYVESMPRVAAGGGRDRRREHPAGLLPRSTCRT